MGLKNNYFSFRLNSLLKEDRGSLAEREIQTIQILEEICEESFISPRKKIADIGCGDRFLEKAFNKKDMVYEGFDIMDLDIETEKVAREDNFYDLVICYALIEHLKSPSNLVSEALRILKPGGAFLVQTPNWHYSSKIFYDDYTHLRPYTPLSLGNLLSAEGFKKIHKFPNLRCKPKYFYSNRFSFFIANILPFKGGGSSLIPSFLKGRSKGMILVAIK